jgi:hypothetical protein
MRAVNFEGCNSALGAPKGMESSVYTLNCYRYVDDTGMPQIISGWKVSEEDLENIRRTGIVWVQTMGETLAPFCVYTSSQTVNIIEDGNELKTGGPETVKADSIDAAPSGQDTAY